jgi:DMSO/TMAO reductase YedYZ molybdopterin-dependent catalytic subunit
MDAPHAHPKQPRLIRPGFALHQPDVAALTDFRTALPDVFWVTHMGIMDVPTAGWTLSIDGLVDRATCFSWEDLIAFPRKTVVAAHECAGSPLAPRKPVRRVANVEWEGVPLASLLQHVGINAGARFLWSTGADDGDFAGAYRGFFQKDLPLSKALDAHTLLATHINGEPLSPERGAPLRLVVPGYYGTNSTKWLRSLSLQETRAPSYYTTTLYNDEIEHEGKVQRRPVWGIAPHAIIVSHSTSRRATPGLQEIRGWAWALSGIALVEVSLDGGHSWQSTRLGPRVDYSWQQFSLDWSAVPGAHTLLCRAVATDGSIQPASGARNEWFAVDVQVDPS